MSRLTALGAKKNPYCDITTKACSGELVCYWYSCADSQGPRSLHRKYNITATYTEQSSMFAGHRQQPLD